MVGRATNRLMRLIRGKGHVNGPGKPKDRGSKPKWANVAGMIASRPIGMVGRGTVEIEVQWARWVGTFTQAMPSLWGNEGRQCKPKSPHILYVVKDRYEPSTCSRTR